MEHDEFQSGNMLILALSCTEGPGLELDLAHSGYQRRTESSNKSPRIKCRVIHTTKKYQRKIELAYPLSLNISNKRCPALLTDYKINMYTVKTRE